MLVARITPDDPLLVRQRLCKDVYTKKLLTFSKTVTYYQDEYVSAQEARSRGYQVDDKAVLVKVSKPCTRQVEWLEYRLVKRAKTREKKGRIYVIPPKTCRPRTTRAEFADARQSPMYYAKDVADRVKQEVDWWKTHNMGTPAPVALVLLGLKENSDGTYITYTRAAYYIVEHGIGYMVLQDTKGNQAKLDTKGLYQHALIMRFILFLPSNVTLE